MQNMSDEMKSVLGIVLRGGLTRGNILRRRASINDPEKLLQAVRGLMDLGFIEVSGPVDDPKSIQSAVFSPVPSTRSVAQKALKS